jgi:hypothetical protein
MNDIDNPINVDANQTTPASIQLSPEQIAAMDEAAFADHATIGPSTLQSPTPNVAPEPTTDTLPEPQDEATAERYRQTIAQNNRLLSAVGIDPASDIAARFNQGLLTEDDILRHVASKTQPYQQQMAPQTQQTPEPAPLSTAEMLAEMKSKDGISQDDIIGFLEAQEIEKQNTIAVQRQSYQDTVINDCVGAVDSVIAENPMFKQMPPEMQENMRQVFRSSTDNLVLRETERLRLDPQGALTPQNYDYYARQNMVEFQRQMDYLTELGRKTTLASLSPAGRTNINPIPVSAGSSPPVPAQAPVTRDNWKNRANSYFHNDQNPGQL